MHKIYLRHSNLLENILGKTLVILRLSETNALSYYGILFTGIMQLSERAQNAQNLLMQKVSSCCNKECNGTITPDLLLEIAFLRLLCLR